MASKKCPKCAESVRREALVCKHCGHQFDAQQMAADERHRRNTKIFTYSLIGVIAFIALATPKSESSRSTDKVATSTSATPAATGNDAPEKITAEWYYSENTDPIRKKQIRSASMVSDNKVEFDFPYQGGAYLSATVRDHPEYGRDVYFTISKGHFLCSSWDGCSGMISIDGKAERLTLGEPDDNDNDVLFATHGRAIARKLTGAREVIVELPFYREGNRQFTFTIGKPLEWPPKS